jgi:hypothetical protein
MARAVIIIISIKFNFKPNSFLLSILQVFHQLYLLILS